MARKYIPTKKLERITRCGTCFNDFVFAETVKSEVTEGAYVDIWVGWACPKCCGVVSRCASKKKDKKAPVKKPRVLKAKKKSPKASSSPDTDPETEKSKLPRSESIGQPEVDTIKDPNLGA
jgi:hypothetical protein